MKRLYIALAILAVVFGGTLYNAYYLNTFTSDLSALLERAEARAESGDWNASHKLTEQAYDFWKNNTLYLHVFLRHNNTDDVEMGFHEVQEFINMEERGEYSAANARLVTQIGLLYEAEQLSLKNIL